MQAKQAVAPHLPEHRGRAAIGAHWPGGVSGVSA